MHVARQVLFIQAVIGIITAAAWSIASLQNGLAALFGVLTATVPGLWFYWRTERATRLVADPERMLGAVNRAQFGKFILTFGLFAISAGNFPDRMLPVLTGFAACIAAYWLLPAFGHKTKLGTTDS